MNTTPTHSRYEAILFDLDGTLIDTNTLYRDAVIDALQEYGYIATHEQFHQLYSTGTLMEPLLQLVGADMTLIDDIRAVRDRKYMTLLQQSATLCDGADDILSWLLDHPTGIITGSYRKYVDQFYERLQLSTFIDVLITNDDLNGKMKPDPHGLFLAAKQLGVDPTQCIYIGDQPFDVEAAKRACMTSCLIRTPHTPVSAHGKADYEVDDLFELQKILW